MSDTATPADKATRYGPRRQKVPAFARFRGTSFYKKFRTRAREYEKFKAAQRQAGTASAV